MAVARGATLDQAEGVRTSASASHNPYRAREAEPGSPSKSVTTTLSISVILLTAATTPVQRLGAVFARLTQPYQPSTKPLSARPAHRPFRGLLSVHSRCGPHTRTVTYVTAIRGLQTFRCLHACPGCFRLERFGRRGLHPLEMRRLVTAHGETRRSRAQNRSSGGRVASR